MTDDFKQLDDQQLVAALNSGNQAAFGILYERYKTWVLNLSYRFTGNHDDALDVVQETFAYFVKKFPGFVLTAQMTTFLYPAVKNYSLAAKKKRLRNTGGDEKLEGLAGPEPQHDESRQHLTEILKTLSDSHREILLARYVDQLTQPEIAAAMNLPLGTVKSRLHHAIQSVRRSPVAQQLLKGEQRKQADH